MTSILGISAFYHDSAAALIIDGDIVAAAQEERFSRKKHDARYPFNAVNFVLNEGRLRLSEVDHIVFFEKPFLKFERLLETYMAFAPKGFKSFSLSMPIWLREKLFQKKFLFDNLKLRMALGQTGNMPQAKSKYTTMGSSNIGGINGLVASSTRGNSSIKPERTSELEIGSDFSLMNGLATVEITSYAQYIEDLILLVDEAPSSGASYSWQNGGEMETKGLEFALGVNPTKLVDLGGLDGLLHITDLSWKRVMHPKEVLNVGDKMDLMVLSFDSEKMRVSLGLKQLSEDPWKDIESKYHVGQVVNGEVALTTDYGCFVKLDDDIEGLVHITDLDWKNKNINPASILEKGDKIDVKIMEIDLEERKVSLSKKHTTENPWKEFEDKHNNGDILEGLKIKSVTDFGVFVELDGGIDGLIHHSEIDVGTQTIQDMYQVGEEVTVSISGMDSERERISLSLVS